MTGQTAPSAGGALGLPRLGPAGDGKALPRGSMPDAVADILREAILDGVLEPGAWLREAEVSSELQVSRTPVRDAFRILAAEGLLTIKANQGAIVSPTTSDDILELYVMREVLEALAARLAARRAPERCMEEFARLLPMMKRAAEENNIAELYRLNFTFHTIIREAAGNRYLQRSLAQLQNAARRFPDPTMTLPGRTEESIQEHVSLAEAISGGDVEAAEELAGRHMRRLSELRIRMLLTK